VGPDRKAPMTRNHKNHSNEIVRNFKELLPAEALQAIDEEHFEELALMIESALCTAVLEHIEEAADQLTALAKAFRKKVEHFEEKGSR
jgi:hypothetical protein